MQVSRSISGNFNQTVAFVVPPRVRKYQKFGPTVDWSPQIQSLAASITACASAAELLHAIKLYVDCFVQDEDPAAAPVTILQSRLTPATAVLRRRVVSCGSVTTLAASLLRCLGLPVKLVHGTYRGNDHAWLECWDQTHHKWLPVDLMEMNDPRLGLAPGHRKLMECADWLEIESVLVEAQRRYANTSA
jgi:transglutaminase-like putative cysteine protease